MEGPVPELEAAHLALGHHASDLHSWQKKKRSFSSFGTDTPSFSETTNTSSFSETTDTSSISETTDTSSIFQQACPHCANP
jgi:hypothetical protein